MSRSPVRLRRVAPVKTRGYEIFVNLVTPFFLAFRPFLVHLTGSEAFPDEFHLDSHKYLMTALRGEI